MSQPYLVFGAPDIREEEIGEVLACLRSGWIGTGPRTARFESDLAAYKGLPATSAVAVNSCTAALHLSLIAADLEPGSEVITTPLTFCATVNAIIHAGHTPVLADVDPVTQNIDPDAIEQAITPKTRAIVPVHFAGRPCDMDRITELASRHKLAIIEDCAHAVEAEYRGKKAGTFGEFGCFSFYATKNVTTGEGGMVLARDPAAAARVRTLALHGMSKDAWHRFSDSGFKHYQVVECGFKYNMMDLQAAIGIHQLSRADRSWRRRQDIWNYYSRELADLPVALPAPVELNTTHAYHLYTLGLDSCLASRDSVMGHLHTRGIGTGVHYMSVATHPYYQQRFGWNPDSWPAAHRIGLSTLSIPLSPALTGTDVERVVHGVRAALTEHAN